MAVYEVSESGAKAIAVAVARISSPSAKIVSEVEYFRTALASVGIDFDELSPEAVIACQDVLYSPWQASATRRIERDAERDEAAAKAARDRLAALEKKADAKADAKAKKIAELRKIEEDEIELEALRAKFSG